MVVCCWVCIWMIHDRITTTLFQVNSGRVVSGDGLHVQPIGVYEWRSTIMLTAAGPQTCIIYTSHELHKGRVEIRIYRSITPAPVGNILTVHLDEDHQAATRSNLFITSQHGALKLRAIFSRCHGPKPQAPNHALSWPVDLEAITDWACSWRDHPQTVGILRKTR